MKVLFDTNVLLDVLLDREPFALHSAAVLSKAERGEITAYACATTLTTIFYLCRKALGKVDAQQHVDTLLGLLDIAPVNRRVLENALQSRFDDFEDAVLSEAAILVSAEIIISRNTKDFVHSPIAVYTPTDVLKLLAARSH